MLEIWQILPYHRPRFTQIEYANAPPRVQKNTPLSIREVM